MWKWLVGIVLALVGVVVLFLAIRRREGASGSGQLPFGIPLVGGMFGTPKPLDDTSTLDDVEDRINSFRGGGG